MDKDFNDMPNFMSYGNIPNSVDMNDIYKDPMFNHIMQYEQAYSYYRYLCMQMDYKIKCKEYEKMCGASSNEQERNRSQAN